MIFFRFGPTQKGAESQDLVSNLKIELERCLLSNKEKRIQVNKLQEELRTCKKDLEEFRMRCERAEKSETDLKVELLLFLFMYIYCLFPEVSVLV